MSNRPSLLPVIAGLALACGLTVLTVTTARAAEPTAAAPAVATPAAPAARPDFSGLWQLDPKASDDPAALGPGPGRGPGGGPGGPGRGGRGRGGGMGGGPASDPGGGRMPGQGFDGEESQANERDEAAGRRSAREFGHLEIFHAADELNLTDGMQISRSLRIGGAPAEVFTPRGTVRAAAVWEGQSLVLTERDAQDQVRRTRQLILSPDRSTLTVKEIRHLPGKDGSQTLTMVYRRQDGAERP
jgi:hypothetical protein